MKNFFVLSIIFCAFFLAACAGTPPAWWNPSGTYNSSHKQSTSQQVRAVPSGSVRVKTEEETPAEQDIDPTEDDYEEIALSPIDEQAEAKRLAEQSADTLPATSGQVQVPVDRSSPAPVKDNLPQDEELPLPSVLESL